MGLARGGALVAVAVAVALGLAGCGGGGHERRDAVNAYFDRVDRAQSRLTASTGQIDAAFRNFSLTKNSAAERRELRFARDRIRGALDGVRAVTPPREARRIHADLVRMLELELAVARELVQATGYQPRLARTLAPLNDAGKTLAAELGRAGKPGSTKVSSTAAKTVLDAYAGAFAHYRETLERIVAGLDELAAPPTLRPTHDAERRTLARAAELSGRVARALAAEDVDTANAAIAELFSLTGAANDPATRAAAARAVRAYNARLRRIATLGARITRERERLVQLLG